MPPMPASLRAVIFDFDGLVVDTESVGYLTWKEIFESHGQGLPLERYAQVVGTDFNTAYDPRRDLETLTGRGFDWATMETLRCEREKALHHTMGTLPGVRDLLSEARSLGLRTAIASSSPQSWIMGWMEKLILRGHFDHFSTVDDTGKVKPDPRLFLHAAENLGVAAEEVLIFEDSLNGLRAARAAGMRCIVAPGPMTRHLDFTGAWRQVNSLVDISLRAIQSEW
jgi:putative hydrolase of the HAD superfamily